MTVDVPAAASALRDMGVGAPDVTLVLGSGLGGLAESVEEAVDIPFSEVPGYPPPGVAGHAGRYVWGRLAGARVLVQAGRFHLYEGHPPDVVVAPVRVARALRTGVLLLTNAAGGIAEPLEPGSLMLIEDHLDFTGRNPLVGPTVPGETRFPDLTRPYDAELRRTAVDTAGTLGIGLHRGVYAAVSGPSYETPAEIRMLERLGADAVGMSTVPEVITARAGGIRCLAFSVITNRAAGRSASTLAHEEVVEVGREAGRTLARLLTGVVERIARTPSGRDGSP